MGDLMNKLYMGIDIGSISTKGVIIDEYNNIITSSYLYTSGNPINAVKNVIKNMREDIDLNKYQVVSVGTTGSARKLIGTMIGAKTIKNEITAHAVGTVKLYPDVRTIFEIGGQYYISEVNPRFGGGYPHAYESGCDHMKMILNNLNGVANAKKIGAYEEGIYMMKYNEVMIRKVSI